MKRYLISMIFLLAVSCKSENGSASGDKVYKGARSMNQPSRPVAKLENLVVKRGDTSAYYELFYYYVDNSRQDRDFFYYAYTMAFKHNYAKAYWDCFQILASMYKIDTSQEDFDLANMDPASRELALRCLKAASDQQYLDVEKLYNRLKP